MSVSQGGVGMRPESEIIRGDVPNLRLLRWRLGFAVVLTGTSAGMVLMGPLQVTLPGVVVSLGLLYTTLAACWAAALVPLNPKALLAVQLSADTLVIGLLVHFTGGPFSILPLAFCFPIMLGAYFLGSRGAMTLAGAAAIFTGGGHFGLALGWMLAGSSAPVAYLQGWPVMVTALHLALFIFTGMISASLAQKLTMRRRQKQRSEEITAKARCELRNILLNIRSGLLTVDIGGVVTRMNPAAERILGLKEHDVLGQNLELITAGGMEELAQVVLPIAAGSPPLPRGEIQVVSKNGIMPLGLNVNPVLSNDGQLAGAIVIFTDLTREKEMTARIRESDRMAAVGELAASIAHEIRNPLASIRGSVEMLAAELDLEGNLDQLLSLVLKESARVNTIINDFLAYSRMRPVFLRRIAADEFMVEVELQAIQHVVAHGGKVDVEFNCQPQDMVMMADPAQLTQLILNLVINSCEAMDYAGRIDLELSLTEDGHVLEVHDSGPGIDPEIRKDLFAPFKTTKEKGTGLGLAMVARIASAHGGHVSVGQGVSGGAMFTFNWPLQPPVREESAENPAYPSVSAENPATSAFQQ